MGRQNWEYMMPAYCKQSEYLEYTNYLMQSEERVYIVHMTITYTVYSDTDDTKFINLSVQVASYVQT